MLKLCPTRCPWLLLTISFGVLWDPKPGRSHHICSEDWCPQAMLVIIQMGERASAQKIMPKPFPPQTLQRPPLYKTQAFWHGLHYLTAPQSPLRVRSLRRSMLWGV